MDIAIHVVFGLVLAGAAALLWLSLKDFVAKESEPQLIITKKHYLIWLSIALGAVGFFGVFFPFVLQGTHVGGKVMIALGSLMLGLSLFTFITTFVTHYYAFNVQKVWVKQTKLATIISGVLSLLFLIVLLDGLTYNAILSFPLPKGFPFDHNPPLVAFYAIFILSGAVLVLFISDHEFYKKYGRHGILENVFYVAFPAGILGARLWFVAGQWNHPDYNFANDLLSIFAFRDGGLAIMGGAVFGIIVGVLFFILRRKEYSINFAFDVIVPTILIAQAIGRWGNFTNQEVYGGVITNINDWWFLPQFVKEQMYISGSFRQPFFLIESVLNLTGYFVIRYGIGVGLKKFRKPLDMGLSYLVWYGVVRAIMEPLRDAAFNMGANGTWSVVNALTLVGVGVLLIVINHAFNIHARIDKWQGLNVVATSDGEETRE